MPNLSFKQVDVFTSVPFKGNPLAVILEAEGLSTEQMLRIANWTNLSETTFVVAPTDPSADYHVRIFTPQAELPFAGHPTVGTAHALMEAGMIAPKDGRLVQQCGMGLVPLLVEESADGERWISLQLPEPTVTPLSEEEIGEIEGLLGAAARRDIPPQVVNVGPRWVIAQFETAREVMALRPDLGRMKAHNEAGNYTGVVAFGEHDRGMPARIELRTFAPAQGINEDPVCGSCNGSVAAFIRATGQTEHFGAEYLAWQGAAVGRAGVIRIAIGQERILVGGDAVTCIDGTLTV